MDSLKRKVVVVYHPKTKKIYQFSYNKYGAIEIYSNDKVDLNTLRVKMVDPKLLDMDNGYLLESANGKQKKSA